MEVLETDEHLGVIAGEQYVAKVYWLSPTNVSLLRRVGDNFNPRCTMTADEVRFVSLTAVPDQATDPLAEQS